MSRSMLFPTALCSISEQVYFSALDRGWGADDDAGLIRIWTSEPVASIQKPITSEERDTRLQLVINLLTGIHLVSTAESISLAKRVGISLPQLYELARDAAGGSAMFQDAGARMIAILDRKEDGGGQVLGSYVELLRIAVNEAQAIKCPTYLGAGALSILLQSGSSLSLASLLKCYGE